VQEFLLPYPLFFLTTRFSRMCIFMMAFAHHRAALVHLLFVLTIVFAGALILREPVSLLLDMSSLLSLYVDATVLPRASPTMMYLSLHRCCRFPASRPPPLYLSSPLLLHSLANTVVAPVTSGARFVIDKLGDGHMIWWIYVW
jgi:hypothetical protein